MLHLLEDLAIVGRVRTPPPALRGVTAAAACACTHVYDIFGRVGMYGSMNASTHQSHVLWGLHAQSGAREGTRCLPQAPERERGACLLPLLTKRDMRCDPAEELADRDSGRSCDLSDASEPMGSRGGSSAPARRCARPERPPAPCSAPPRAGSCRRAPRSPPRSRPRSRAAALRPAPQASRSPSRSQANGMGGRLVNKGSRQAPPLHCVRPLV